jgi:hypothetical protein
VVLYSALTSSLCARCTAQEFCRASSRTVAPRDGCVVSSDGQGTAVGYPPSLEEYGDAIQTQGKGLLRRFLTIGVRRVAGSRG